jgi:DNA-binding beta-propeller fold protein YncE
MMLAALASIPLHGGCGPATGDPPNPPGPAPDAGPISFPRASCDAPLAPAAEPQPGVHIVFPPAPGLTHEAAITVRGTAALDAGVAAIRVNGVAAESADGFRTWQVSVPLALGANTLVVESEDAAGTIDPAAAQQTVVRAQEPLAYPQALALDASANRALIVDRDLNAVVAVALDTGARSILFEQSRVGEVGAQARPLPPAPPSPFELMDVALDVTAPVGERVLVLAAGQLIAVDATTGAATILSDATTGSGPMPVALVDMAVDATGGRALVLDAWTDTLLAIDLTTGARTVIADATTGSGLALSAVTGVALDAPGNRALVTMGNDINAALVAVNLTTGARTVLSGLSTGIGEELTYPEDLVLDAARERVVIADGSYGRLIAVDLGTGNRALLSDEATTSGPLIEWPAGMAVDEAGARVLIIDGSRKSLISVDLETGARTLLVGDAIGSGYELRSPGDLALDPEARRVLVYDGRAPALLAIDLETGARTVISGPTVGQGPSLADVLSLALDPARQRVLASSGFLETSRIFAVDLTTGDRTVMSGDGVGEGVELDLPWPLLVDPARGRVLTGMQTGLVAVDLDTGDRTLLSPAVGHIHMLAMEPECDRVLFGSGSGVSGLFALELGADRLSLIADYATCPGAPIYPERPFYDPATGRVVLAHYAPMWQVVVDTRAGTCTEEGNIAPEAGYPPYSGAPVLRDPATGLLLVIDQYTKSLVALDPATGAHVILSR